MIQKALDFWTIKDLGQIFPVRWEDQTEPSRQWMIWHMLEHDIYHGSEISSILGTHGLAAVTLE